jgi:hypothetical protein
VAILWQTGPWGTCTEIYFSVVMAYGVIFVT